VRTLDAAVALALAFAAHSAAAAAPNALLVVDQNNQRVLRVALPSGGVTVFSPPPGAQGNLLTSARGIGVGPDGTIVVANYVENTLVEIDPATGAQFPVEGIFSGLPAIGAGPLDVAVNPRQPAPGFLPTLGVASRGELHQVVRNPFDTTGSLLAPYPSPYDTRLGAFLAVRDPGASDPVDYYVTTGGTPAILRYDGASDTIAPFRDYGDVDSIQGLAAPETGLYVLIVSFIDEPCPSSNNGVHLIRDAGTDSFYGGSYECPGPIAFDASTAMLYTADRRGNPQQIVAYDTDLFGSTSTVPIATLPSGAIASDMAVASVPEPSGAALAALALLALAALATASRRITLAWITGCTALVASTQAAAAQLRAGDLLVTDSVGSRAQPGVVIEPVMPIALAPLSDRI